jgi:hypothetical protein
MLKPRNYQKPANNLQPAGHAPITGVPGMDFSGPTRLEDLEEQYPYTHGFEESVIKAVQNGDIGLLPLSNVVHVKTTDN